MPPRSCIDSSPYIEGCSLHLYSIALQRSIEVQIIKVFSPSTLSCVMQVEMPGTVIQSSHHRVQAILKMFDWRFAKQLRDDQKVEPWSPRHSSAYLDFVRSGEAEKFLHRLEHDEDFEEPDEGWTVPQDEAYMFGWCRDLFKTETRVYTTLESLQGHEIPKLFSGVTLNADSSGKLADLPQELLTINGMLLEYIDGTLLSELPEASTFHRNNWQGIVDQALSIVHKITDHDILNKDVRPANIIASKCHGSAAEHSIRVVMIDFALCEFRGPKQTDLEWGRMKWTTDEEGAVGLVMKNRLQKHGFELNFEHTLRHLEFAPGEDD